MCTNPRELGLRNAKMYQCVYVSYNTLHEIKDRLHYKKIIRQLAENHYGMLIDMDKKLSWFTQ